METNTIRVSLTRELEKAKTYNDYLRIARQSCAVTYFKETGGRFIVRTAKGGIDVHNHPGNFGGGLKKKLDRIFENLGIV